MFLNNLGLKWLNIAVNAHRSKIDLIKIALKLKNGYSTSFLCEVCKNRAVYKVESGRIYLAKEINGEIELEETTIENLI